MRLRLAPVGIFTTLVFTSLILSVPATATSIDWEGRYRFEIVDIENPSLSKKNPNSNKAYWLNYAELRPSVIASDSLTLRGRFVLLPNSSYPNSHLGSFMGSGVAGSSSTGDSPAAGSDVDDSDVLGDSQAFTSLAVAEMYMTWEQEYGALIVGRSPLEFGLGMQYSSGRGLFDHWADTRDLLGYKIATGNMYLFPMFTTLRESNLGTGSNDVKEQIFQMGYKNPDSHMELGFIYVNRFAPVSGGNDAPASTIGGAGATIKGHWNVQDINLFVAQAGETYKYGLEFGFRNGRSGVQTSEGTDVKMESYGLAAEFSYRPEDWTFGMKFAYATGDDPSSDDKYEGYFFDRNYDMGFLMFNHPLGNAALNSGIHLSNPSSLAEDLADEDTITNANVLAPYVTWAASDSLDLTFTYVLGNLNQEIRSDAGTSLGSEIDISLGYRPYEKMQWVTTIGYFSPGSAFAGSSSDNFDTEPSFGFTTKAAINF